MINVTDPVEAAQAAGLRYVSDAKPGIRRELDGAGFRYIGKDGQPIQEEKELARIQALGIPPAWSEVWICPSPRGHIQATGRDAKGRKQYRYHPRWRAVRDETKYGRMIAFGAALPELRAQVEADLGRAGLPREKVLATVVRLLERTLIRVGNEEYARTNESFGLTTLHADHVAVQGTELHFRFRGKSGKDHDITIHDRRLARIVKRCQALPGHELFQYQADAGEYEPIDSADVNAYLRAITGQEFTAKDFRTWHGTVRAVQALRELEPGESEAQAKKNIVQAIKSAAEQLGNTPTICRKCYVHPAVLDAYLAGTLLPFMAQQAPAENGDTGLSADEQAVLAFLREHLGTDDG